MLLVISLEERCGQPLPCTERMKSLAYTLRSERAIGVVLTRKLISGASRFRPYVRESNSSSILYSFWIKRNRVILQLFLKANL
jgi:hypothetical protein